MHGPTCIFWANLTPFSLQRENPAVRYGSRKKIADNRPRIKGRFVKTDAAVTVTSISA